MSPTVELDEIFRSFDPKTREAFQVWMQTQAQAIEGRGRDLNDALGNLGPFAEDASVAVDILNRQEGALRRLIANTGVVFGALTERDDQLRGLIENSNRVFATTASRDQRAARRRSSRCRPSRASRGRRSTASTSSRDDTDPLVTQLRPAARELSPTLQDLSALAPDARALFRDLDKLITASKDRLPGGRADRARPRPLLAQTDPALRQLIPILDFIGLYKGELIAFFANTRPPPRPTTPARACTTCAPPTRSTPRTSPPIRAGSAPTARTPTSCPAATSGWRRTCRCTRTATAAAPASGVTNGPLP